MHFILKHKIFGKGKSAVGKILAVESGKVIPISEVHDEVFAQKLQGDGVAIKPEDGLIVSPVNGRIINVAETYHAYGIQTYDGLEILIHIGLNTVELKGKCFNNHVQINDNVKVGTPLCDVDLSELKRRGYDTTIIIIITNITECKVPIVLHTGIDAKAALTCVIEYQI